jgi:hypothetical protein
MIEQISKDSNNSDNSLSEEEVESDNAENSNVDIEQSPYNQAILAGEALLENEFALNSNGRLFVRGSVGVI